MNEINKTIFSLNRLQINKYSLNYILNYDVNPFTLLIKSFFSFYFIVFGNIEIFNFVNNNNKENQPWNSLGENINIWIPEYILNKKNNTKKNAEIKLWIEMYSLWFDVIFCNPYFYIKYNNISGYGIYARNNVELNNSTFINQIRHGTLIEPISQYEYETLHLLGLDTFFETTIEDTKTTKKKKQLYILYGLWFFGNSENINCNLYFSWGYEFENIDEIDSINRSGDHYRTMFQIYSIENKHDNNKNTYKILLCDVTEEDIKHQNNKNNDINYNEHIIYNNSSENIIKETIQRKVFLACRLSIRYNNINRNLLLIKDEELLINYDYFKYKNTL